LPSLWIERKFLKTAVNYAIVWSRWQGKRPAETVANGHASAQNPNLERMREAHGCKLVPLEQARTGLDMLMVMQLTNVQGVGPIAPPIHVLPNSTALVEPSPREELPPALLAMMMTANRIMAMEAVRAVPDGRLTPPQFRILNYLYVSPGASLSEVASYLGVRLPTASVMLVKLAAEGYVLRSRHPNSRRRMQLVLTDHGQEVTETVRSALFSRLRAGLDRLEETDRAAIQKSMSALRSLFAQV
jgi:DNA-binding MarR family transcriptional regulator